MAFLTGKPGVATERQTAERIVYESSNVDFMPGVGTIDGSESRDIANTSYTTTLRAGTILGKVTSSSLFAPTIIGLTTEAYTSGGTEVTVSAAVAAEIVRRVGSTGSLTIIGPPTAGGTVASVAKAYSAVNTTTGVITIADIGADMVSGSIVAAADGTEVPRCVLAKKDGVRVVDDDANDIDVETGEIMVGGVLRYSMVPSGPTDVALIEWIKDSLNNYGTGMAFDSDFRA